MKVEVLGTGCAKCAKLYQVVSQAARETGLSIELAKVDDIVQIMAFNVLQLPAVAIGGRVVLSGRMPGLEEMKSLLREGAHER